MNICETFVSIQGESSFAGFPCAFIRLSGCNLRCSYCDTLYSYPSGREQSVDQLMDFVIKTKLPLVEITGGEPLLQFEGLKDLSNRMIQSGLTVLVETNGSLPISGLNENVHFILDIKTPGSGMSHHNIYENLNFLTKSDEVKFVLLDNHDYLWSKEIIANFRLIEKCQVLLSPAQKHLSPKTLAGWIIRDKLNARLNIQLHKLIFETDGKGV